MAKKKSKKTAKRAKAKTNHIPLDILKRRLVKLDRIVKSRT